MHVRYARGQSEARFRVAFVERVEKPNWAETDEPFHWGKFVQNAWCTASRSESHWSAARK